MKILLALFLSISAIQQLLPAEIEDLKKQLASAVEEQDSPSIAELCRRILALDPTNSSAWEKRVRALFDLGDLTRCEATLVAWQKTVTLAPAIGEDLWGDIFFARGDHDSALTFWTRYLDANARATKTLEKVAWLHELDKHWAPAIDALTKRISIGDEAGPRVWRARMYLRLRKWDAAFTDIHRANELDATNEAVEAWLPQFERMEQFLAEIKKLDTLIQPAAWELLLDRALLFQQARRPELQLEDAEQALIAFPDSRRAMIQRGYALIQLGRRDEAAKLRFNLQPSPPHPEGAEMRRLAEALRRIGNLDAKIRANSDDAKLLAQRAWECNELNQYGFALDDAEAALKISSELAEANLEAGFALMHLDRENAALEKITRSTELDPQNARAWRCLGEIEMARANYPAAIDFFSRALKYREAPDVLRERRECFLRTGREEEARLDEARIKRFQK
jgi:tetratricopeptide (TPR) repeat protein